MTASGGPRGRDDVVFRALAREWVIYDPVQRQVHVLNATAAMVWSLCDGAHDTDAIAREVREVMRDPPGHPVARKEVEDVIETFAQAGLLQ